MPEFLPKVDSSIQKSLERLLESGSLCMGEILFEMSAADYSVQHHLDVGIPDLTLFTNAEDALEIAKYDAVGGYRPLKTAPTLRRGWKLTLPDSGALRQALDFLYPAMLGSWVAWQEQRLVTTNLRETLNRQSGMYRVTRNISNEQANALIDSVCAPNACLKTILWRLETGMPVQSLTDGKFDPGCNLLAHGAAFLPLLCQEPCNILVAAAREVVKKGPPPSA